MADKKDDLIPEERMKDMSVAPGEPKDENAKKAEDADRDEDNLEEGLEDSMDGSDTPSSLQP